MSGKSGKRPMRALSPRGKVRAINRVSDGESKASVARDLGVPESTLRGWCKNEMKIREALRTSALSSPDTDNSIEYNENNYKRRKLDDNVQTNAQAFNYSIRSSSSLPSTSGTSSYSPNSENRYSLDLSIKKEDQPLDLQTKPRKVSVPKTSPKTSSNISSTERERNRIELARMSVELGLNKPELYPSSMVYPNELNAVLAARFHQLLMQTRNLGARDNGSLLTTVTQQRENSVKLPSERLSVDESVNFWMEKYMTSPTVSPNSGRSNAHPTSTPMTSTGHVPLDVPSPMIGITPEQYTLAMYTKLQQFAQYANQTLQHQGRILHQRLTKPKPEKSNAENVVATTASLPEEKPKLDNRTIKGRAVLDTLLLERPSTSKGIVEDAAIVTNKKNEAVGASTEEKSKMDNRTINSRDVFDTILLDTASTSEEIVEDPAIVIKKKNEAISHGEKFLSWLQSCSEPSVSTMQVLQFKSLLDKIKASAERSNRSAASTSKSDSK